MAPSRWGASVFVTSMAVGPSAPPIIPIAAASIALNPRNIAPAKATNTPNCAEAPRSRLLGLAISGAKSVIAPIPMKMRQG